MTHDERPANGKKRQRRQAHQTVKALRSLDEVAQILGLSRQRVHEIESSAFRKLRHAFLEHMPSLQLQRDKDGFVCGLKEGNPDSPLKAAGTAG